MKIFIIFPFFGENQTGLNTNILLQYTSYISIGQNDRGKHREHEKEQHFFLMSRNEAVNENMMCRVKPFDIF